MTYYLSSRRWRLNQTCTSLASTCILCRENFKKKIVVTSIVNVENNFATRSSMNCCDKWLFFSSTVVDSWRSSLDQWILPIAQWFQIGIICHIDCADSWCWRLRLIELSFIQVRSRERVESPVASGYVTYASEEHLLQTRKSSRLVAVSFPIWTARRTRISSAYIAFQPSFSSMHVTLLQTLLQQVPFVVRACHPHEKQLVLCIASNCQPAPSFSAFWSIHFWYRPSPVEDVGIIFFPCRVEKVTINIWEKKHLHLEITSKYCVGRSSLHHRVPK